MEESLAAKIKVLESNYILLQKEHSILVKGLHEEIEKLQRKYSELAFDYTIRSNKSLETMLLEDKIKQLQTSISDKNNEIHMQKENLNIVQTRNQEKEITLLKQIEDQKNIIESLREIISKRNGDEIIMEKDQKPRKEIQTEKISKRKKKKSTASSDSGNSYNRVAERSPNQDIKAKVMSPKSNKSATASSTNSSVDKNSQISSDNESFPKKGKRDKRNRKKNSALPLCMGDIPILPSDYRAVVATLPPLSQSHEETKLECDVHKFIPCSSGRHSGFSSMKGGVNTLSELHKNLRKPSVKVEGFN